MTDIANSITGGKVSFEDGVKASEEYAPAKKARVELSFEVPEGQDGAKWLDAVFVIATDKIDEILGRTPAKTTVAGGEGQSAGKSAGRKPRAPAAAATQAAEPSKTKEDLAREAGVAAEQVAAATPAKAAAPESDDLSDLLGDAAPAARVISDKELGEICNKEAGRLKGKMGDKYDTKIIRTLVAKFATVKEGEVPKIIAIPADKRVEFVTALEAL